MTDGEKKNFINEKIVGRNISPKNAAKRLLLALLCGLVFGGGAATAFFAVRELYEGFEQAARKKGDDQPDTDGQDMEPETVHDTDEVQDPALEEAPEDMDIPDENVHETWSKPELRAEIEEILDSRNWIYDEQDLRAISRVTAAMAEKASELIAEVHAVSTNTTWFEDTVESSRTFAGLIISDTDSEILILSTDEAADSGESYSVTFSDGTEKEALLKQISRQDGICVIAVSKEGLGEEFLSDMRTADIGSALNVSEGSMVLALGAPLGKIRSFDIGYIGMKSEAEETVDGQQEVFYSSINSDPQHGTFIFNMEGQLIGLAASDKSTESVTGIVSTSYLKRAIDRLTEGEPLPYIGITGSGISFDMSYQGMPSGMYVTEVSSGSPAYDAGIKNGDIITGIGDTNVSDVRSYENAVRLLKSGDSVTVRLMRSSGSSGYTELSFDVNVGTR